MSAMAVNRILITSCKLAVTAMFAYSSLLFVKYLKDMISCRGTFHASEMLPFFTTAHDLANAYTTQYSFANPPTSCAWQNGRAGKLISSPPSFWGSR